MQIIEINMQHFGKFENRQMAFHPGINIIYGGNETGKTTILAFIRAMLYGLPRRSSRKQFDEYTLRQPWNNPEYFAGTMTVEKDGCRYRIERNLNKTSRDVHLINLDDGTEIPLNEDTVGELMTGMNENAFINTVFIPQAGARTGNALAEELRSYLLNVQQAGSGSMDVDRALENLKSTRKRLEKEKQEKSAALDTQIEGCRREMAYIRSEMEEAGKMAGRQAGMEEPGKMAGRQAGIEEPGKIAGRQVCMEEAGKTEGGQEGMEEPEMYSAQRQGPGQYDKPARTPADGYTSENDVPVRKKKRTGIRQLLRLLAILSLTAAVLCLACIFTVPSLPARILLGVLGIYMGLQAAFLHWNLNRAGKGEGKTAGPDRAKAQEAAQLEDSEGKTAGPDRTKAQEDREGKRRLGEEERQMAADQEQAHRDEMQKIQTRRGQRLNELKTKLEQLYDQSDALSSYDRELDAVDLAAGRIREISAQIYHEEGKDFGGRASRILSDLTQGRYTAISFDEKMNVRVSTPDRLLYLEQLSFGAMNQVWFALRMAAGQILGSPGDPLLLDETFSMYDDDRLTQALDYLKHSGRQVILFTCHTRESRMLDALRSNL